MSVPGAQLLWIAALIGTIALWAWQIRRARREAESVGRGAILGAFVLVAALGTGGAWAFGAGIAGEGLASVKAAMERPPRKGEPPPPARARLFLRYVQLFFDADAGAPLELTVGYSPGASLQLPRDYALEEAGRGANVAVISAVGPRGLSVAPADAKQGTLVLVHVEPLRSADPADEERSLAAARRALLDGRRCRVPAEGAAPRADGGDAVTTWVFLCARQPGGAYLPRAALALERDLPPNKTAAVDTPVRVRPYVWRGSAFRPHHVQMAAGTLLQIGAVGDALPGLTVWEIPAPAARSALLFPPRNLLAPCDKWLETNASEEGGFFYPDLGMVRPETVNDADSFACILPFTPPFALEVRRLLPDVAGARTRSLWASMLVVAPALLLLAFFFAQRPSVREPAPFARACGLAVVSAVLGALLTFRLLLAHRLDMMRDYEAVGARVLGNELLVVLVAAALAATAAILAAVAWRPREGLLRLVVAGGVAWAAFLALGWIAVGADQPFPPRGLRAFAQLPFSLALGTAVAWWPLAWHRLGTAVPRVPVAWLALGAVVVSAVVGRLVAPLSVPAKLFCTWAFVPLAYVALREARDWRRGAIASALVVLALGALFVYDTGVAAVVAIPGAVLALLAVAHDHVYSERDVRTVDAFGGAYRPLLVAEAVAVGGVALLAIGWALASTLGSWREAAADGAFPRAFTRAALHLPALACAIFAGLAYAVWRQRRRAPVAERRRFLIWAGIAGLFFVAWVARGVAADAAVRSKSETGQRVASLLDPSWALLSDERGFAEGLTAWRETAVAAADERGAARVASQGQGYFGAQVLDPGVLLSIENDYLPVLLLRESGAWGVTRLVLLYLVVVAALFLVGAGRFAEGTASLRARRVVAILVGLLVVYQPIASLGALPFTGVSWPGLGIDSPTDFWIFAAILLACAVWLDGAAAASETAEVRKADRALRASRPYRRVAPLVVGAVAALALCGALLVLRVGTFAVRPRELVTPVATASGETVVRFNPPFEGLEGVFDYMYRLQCADPAADVDPAAIARLPAPLQPEPARMASLERYHGAFRDAWRAGEERALAEVRAFATSAGASGCGDGRKPIRAGAFTIGRGADAARDCRVTFKYGWPKVDLTYSWDESKSRLRHTCSVDVPEDILRSFRYPLRRPYAGARMRLVSRAMGKTALDAGELVSGNAVVRLRPGAPGADLSAERAGVFYAGSVVLPNDVRVTVVEREGKHIVEISRPASASPASPTPADPAGNVPPVAPRTTADPPRVLVAGGARVHLLEPGALSRWETRLLDTAGAPTPLDQLSVVVTGGTEGRTVWMFRPPSEWPDEPGATVNPLLADDVTTVLGSRRRLYAWGGQLPELGWVNPNLPERSLGLDGWAAVAAASYERAAATRTGDAAGLPSPHARFADRWCGTLDPPAPASTGAEVDRAFGRVCAPSPLDGVLECRVSVQPELETRLRHVLELTAQRPELFTQKKFQKATAASFALLRGDTGEILAHGHWVPGRESSAYAPATPSLEKYLIDAREDRDPVTGARVPPGEAGAEKADWSQPIAIGSTMKPLFARALERAAPAAARAMVLVADEPPAGCKPLLGHCPSTPTVWDHAGRTSAMAEFLSESYNWYQAALGLLGTALPDGKIGWGAEPTEDIVFPLRLGAAPEDRELRTAYGGRPVVLASAIDQANLRATPMWRELENLLGRPLCVGKTKAQCVREAERGDLCAARALPVDAPTRDLRHLVALGPAAFDFADTERKTDRVYIKEYFQFLRGSGKHPLASVLQLADAFNRLFFDGSADRYRLAASWFPSDAVGAAPNACDPAGTDEPTVAEGLCDALRDGTVQTLRGRLAEAGVVFYGAKTGTIDSLGDIADRREACERFNINHTTPDGGSDYHLDCKDPSRNDLNDSLLVLAFGVKQADGTMVPVTLALRWQRVGSVPNAGFAAEMVGPFIDVVLDYFGSSPAP